MEVLLVGNTDFITKQWIQHSFPRDHVVIAEREGTVDGNDRLRIVNMSDANTLAETLTTYEFDRIVFFSEGLTPRSERDGDLGYLRRLLHAIRNRSTQMLMVCGPESEFTYPENADVRDTSKSLMSRASEELCLYYARTYRLEAKIIRCPYLYAPERNGATAYFGRLFEQASAGSISFCERKQQQTCFLCADDLAELIYRMFDDWTAESEIFHVPNVFDFTYGDLADAISVAFPGLSVTFGEDRPQHYPADDHVLILVSTFDALCERKSSAMRRVGAIAVLIAADTGGAADAGNQCDILIGPALLGAYSGDGVLNAIVAAAGAPVRYDCIFIISR
jgi:nucleoside-diphosphate-sugar epimerase